MKKPTILNTPILPTFGTYKFSPLTIKETKDYLSNGFTSAVGHQSTADVMKEVLGIDIPKNRISWMPKIGDEALVFKLNSRPPEGKILTFAEIESIGFYFGRIVRIE